jgi:hypothetical protein
LLEVEVTYALPDRQFLKRVRLPEGSTVRAAIEASGVLQAFPVIDLESAPVGIFSRRTTLDTVLSSSDRVEIYRPLIVSPGEARRERAGQKKDL